MHLTFSSELTPVPLKVPLDYIGLAYEAYKLMPLTTSDYSNLMVNAKGIITDNILSPRAEPEDIYTIIPLFVRTCDVCLHV